MANQECYHAGKPIYCNSAALTSLQVMSWPAPLGPRSPHGGESSVVSSLPFRAHSGTGGSLVTSDESRLEGVTSHIQVSTASRPRHVGLQPLQISRAFSCFGVLKGGRCPPRTVSSRQVRRLASLLAGVSGLHIQSLLTMPYLAMSLMLAHHLVHASGVH